MSTQAEIRSPRPNRMPRWSVLARALCSVPLIAFFVYGTWLNPVSPYFANYDPEFQYLMNSLEVFKGSPYAYVDHPGTPLEVLGSAIFAVTYPVLGKSPNAFILYQLENPARFLTLAHGFLLLTSILSLWYVGGRGGFSENLLGSLTSAALGVMYFAIHPLSFSSLILWSHNCFSFAFGTPLLLLLFRRLRESRDHGLIPARQLVAIGLCIGIFSSITIYLGSWLLGTLGAIVITYRLRRATWFRTLGAALTVIFSSLGGFVFGVLPVFSKMPAFFQGLWQLLTHENTDPVRVAGTTWAGRLTAGFLTLFSQLPALFVSLGIVVLLAAVALIWRAKKIREEPELWAMAIGLAIQTAVLTVFILDRPVPIYMLSVAAILPVLTMVVLKIWEFRPGVGRILERATVVCIFVGFIFAFAQSITAQQANVTRISQVVAQTSQSRQAYSSVLRRAPADLVVLWSYRSYAPCFSLWFGNDSTGRVFRREIGEICYRENELNIWSQKVVSAQGVSTLGNAKWDMIIGCEDGFKMPILANQPLTETFPALRLECGSLSIAYNAR